MLTRRPKIFPDSQIQVRSVIESGAMGRAACNFVGELEKSVFTIVR
jgi:hypothetical protein